MSEGQDEHVRSAEDEKEEPDVEAHRYEVGRAEVGRADIGRNEPAMESETDRNEP
jgi:hypothetical protein